MSSPFTLIKFSICATVYKEFIKPQYILDFDLLDVESDMEVAVMMQRFNSSAPKSPNKFVSAAPKRHPEQLRKGVTIVAQN